MARWRPVDTRVWSDRKFLELGPDARTLWLYFLTAPCSLPIPGVLIGGEATHAEQLGWTVDRYRIGYSEIVQKGLGVRADHPSRLVWLTNALRYQKCPGPKVMKGWSKTWDDIPECHLKHVIWCALRDYAKGYDKQFPIWFKEPIGYLSDTLSEGFDRDRAQEQDPDPDQESISAPPVLTAVQRGAVVIQDLGKKRHAVAKQVWFEHCDRFDAMRGELGLKVPSLRRVEDCQGYRDLVERLKAYSTDLDSGKAACLHVLGVREDEAREKRRLDWFGDKVWREDQFTHAVVLERKKGGIHPPRGYVEPPFVFPEDLEGAP